jgi:hypothetical protein
MAQQLGLVHGGCASALALPDAPASSMAFLIGNAILEAVTGLLGQSRSMHLDGAGHLRVVQQPWGFDLDRTVADPPHRQHLQNGQLVGTWRWAGVAD